MIIRLPHSVAVAALVVFTSLAPCTAVFAQAPIVASQDAPRKFGRAGQVVITAGPAVSVQRLSCGGSTGSSHTVSIPVGVFVSERILVSLTPTFYWGKQRYGEANEPGETSSGLSLAPTLAWNFVINQNFSLLPTASLGIGWSRRNFVSAGEEVTQKDTSHSIGMSMPLLFHPGPHMFFGLGPSFSVSRSKYGEQRQTYVSFSPLAFTLGGWF